MERALEPSDLIVAGIAVAAGLLAALLLRTVLRWLGERASRTRWNGDDLIVDAVRTLVPVAAVAAGLAVAAAALPLTPRTGQNVTRVLTALLILAGTVTAARISTGLVKSVAQSRSGVAGSATIFANITRVVVLAMGFLVLLQTLGVSIAPLLTALGVGGLAVALALQDTLANLFAGVHILASKTVRPGDYIRLSSGEEGYVVDINWRNTVVRQLSNNLVIIPNLQLAGTNMTNFSRPAQDLEISVQVGVSYDSDLEQVERVTSEVVAEVMRDIAGALPEHQPAVRFHTFGDSRIGFTVILGIGEFSNQYRVKHEFIKRLHQRYRAEGIRVPSPVRNVTVVQGGIPDGLAPGIPQQRQAPDQEPLHPAR
ncbi:mechanosensitive ion channel family protein [Streptomyces candidus]|uniref:Small-conductance mechanosensitive channel n=1 Tax=Streptomyces candidus TaxID=67283 RepID=A0A7X0HFM0_9ACTN|nr:mechanosensitive ion channel family protein [Streptomyces candidus]MBB6436757.1 small-conductance mechanosensitive channel [Streptomyces candidus]GHH51285.1 mechanosensitive ion channel protein [Streptomyces candidus]